jgi:hypothetical protein
MSQLKICDFSGGTFKSFELLYFLESKDGKTALQRRVLHIGL